MMLIAWVAGAFVFLIGLVAALLVERGGFRSRAVDAEYDALSAHCEAVEQFDENERLRAELSARPRLDINAMQLKAGRN